jgi:PAS domain S-box-containing protein
MEGVSRSDRHRQGRAGEPPRSEVSTAIFYEERLADGSTRFYREPSASGFLGYAPEDWGSSRDSWFLRLHPDDADRVRNEHGRSAGSGAPFRSEYRMLAKDGRVVWVRDEAVPVRDAGDDSDPPLVRRGVILDITTHRDAEERLRWSLDVLRRTVQQRRELAQRLEGAREEERRRIAADIHDDPIQAMSAVDLRLQMLSEDGDPPPVEVLEELQATVRAAVDRLRSLLFELRPARLDADGLVPALQLYLDHTAAEAGWRAVLTDALDDEPPADVRALIYRTVQEALTNVRKHANASVVDVAVGSADGGVTVLVRDDGDGFDVARALLPRPGHLGISTMVERAELLGGWCRVRSVPGAGATIECWFPIGSGNATGAAPSTGRPIDAT